MQVKTKVGNVLNLPPLKVVNSMLCISCVHFRALAISLKGAKANSTCFHGNPRRKNLVYKTIFKLLFISRGHTNHFYKRCHFTSWGWLCFLYGVEYMVQPSIQHKGSIRYHPLICQVWPITVISFHFSCAFDKKRLQIISHFGTRFALILLHQPVLDKKVIDLPSKLVRLNN